MIKTDNRSSYDRACDDLAAKKLIEQEVLMTVNTSSNGEILSIMFALFLVLLLAMCVSLLSFVDSRESFGYFVYRIHLLILFHLFCFCIAYKKISKKESHSSSMVYWTDFSNNLYFVTDKSSDTYKDIQLNSKVSISITNSMIRNEQTVGQYERICVNISGEAHIVLPSTFDEHRMIMQLKLSNDAIMAMRSYFQRFGLGFGQIISEDKLHEAYDLLSKSGYAVIKVVLETDTSTMSKGKKHMKDIKVNHLKDIKVFLTKSDPRVTCPMINTRVPTTISDVLNLVPLQ